MEVYRAQIREEGKPENMVENIAKGKWLIVILDHVLLVDGDSGERSTIVNLQKLFIEKKKLKNTRNI